MDIGALTTDASSPASLAELYNSALDRFDYVHLGNRFRPDVQTSVVRIDSARLKLSRWGEVVGLSGSLIPNHSLNITVEGKSQAEDCLRRMLNAFSEAEDRSAHVKARAGTDCSDLEVLILDVELDPISSSLHALMHTLVEKRKHTAQSKRQSDWAIYREEDYKKFLKDINGLAHCLTETARDNQDIKRLCEYEVLAIGSTDRLCLLWGIIAGYDNDLGDAIRKAIKKDGESDAKTGTWINNNYGRQVVITGSINGHHYINGCLTNSLQYTFHNTL